MNEVRRRRSPNSPHRGVGDDDHPGEEGSKHEGEAGHRGEDSPDDIRLDDVDDQVLHLHAQAGQPLAATAVEAMEKDFADCLDAQSPIGDRIEDAEEREREEGVDRVPHAPDAAGNDVSGDAIGRGAADAGARDANRYHQHAHLAAGDRPVVAAATSTQHAACRRASCQSGTRLSSRAQWDFACRVRADELSAARL